MINTVRIRFTSTTHNPVRQGHIDLVNGVLLDDVLDEWFRRVLTEIMEPQEWFTLNGRMYSLKYYILFSSPEVDADAYPDPDHLREADIVDTYRNIATELMCHYMWQYRPKRKADAHYVVKHRERAKHIRETRMDVKYNTLLSYYRTLSE